MLAKLKILILEDNENDAYLLKRELKNAGLHFETELVQTRANFELALVNFNPDIILSDYSLPSFDAVTAFKIKQAHNRQIPFIIVSGVIGEENAVDLIKNGVTDYVSKNNLFTIANKINRALSDTAIRLEKKLIDDNLKIQQLELQKSNHLLIIQEEKVKVINEQLSILNSELEERVANRTQALVESEYKFRKMIETIPQIAWTNDKSGKVIFYNQRWYDYTGLTAINNDFKDFVNVIHPDDMPESLRSFNEILSAAQGGEFQARAKRTDGSYRWHLVRLMPIRDESGKMILWVGTATDIQELRILQQQKDDFISIASHELKTPITSLKGSLQLLDRLKHRPDSPSLPKLIEQANKSMARVVAMIDDLLNTSMVTNGHLELHQQKFALAKVIDECCEDSRKNGYKIAVSGDFDAEVFADQIKIEQIIVNFVNNAIKYAPNSKEISVTVVKLKQMVKITVIDQGPGIENQKLKFLFDRYFQVAKEGANYSGLGLGLYICSEIVKNHHGQIGVESTVGKGSKFWFTLPLA